jgi:hypothetical protein
LGTLNIVLLIVFFIQDYDWHPGALTRYPVSCSVDDKGRGAVGQLTRPRPGGDVKLVHLDAQDDLSHDLIGKIVIENPSWV